MPTALITGAGSGVGRAVAIALAKLNWRLALLGRRREPLEETAGLCGGSAESPALFTCNIADADSVYATIDDVTRSLGKLDALVNCAGTNTPRRHFRDTDFQAFRDVVSVNLDGAFALAHATIPHMRSHGAGTIVNVISDAGRFPNDFAGTGYIASKFGLTGLTRTINIEERHNGIRATAILPGEINTPLVDKRAEPPSAERRAKMLQAEDVADCILLALNLPQRAVVEELWVMPREK